MQDVDLLAEVQKVPTTLTGLWGELAAVLRLRELGFEVEWDGGLTKGRDLRAVRSDGVVWEVQVKASTASDGRIAWRKDGSSALAWADIARRSGAVPVYVMVHFPERARAWMDDVERELVVRMPREWVVTAVVAEQFAAKVDEARAEYGAQTRQRNDRFGRAGEPLGADGLLYPVSVDDFGVLGSAGPVSFQ